MKLLTLLLRTLGLAAILFAAATARADITVFTNQAAFNAAVTNTGTDTFNDLSPGVQYAGPLSRMAGAYDYKVTGGVSTLFGAGTASDAWLSSNNAKDAIIFGSFSGGVTAFGGNFFSSDIHGAALPFYSITLTAYDGTTLSYTLDGTETDSFLGVTSSSPLVLVSIYGDGSGLYWPTANNITLGMAAPVPEPGSFAMLLAGLPLAGAALRRRRR